MMFGLTGCYTATFNSLGHEDNIVYENNDKTVILEIGTKTSPYGKLYLFEDDSKESFVVYYFIPREMLTIYIDPPELEENRFVLDISFKRINYFKRDYDTMILNSDTNKVLNPEHEIFSNFDVTLNRVYDKEVDPLNYFNNTWESLENEMEFVNHDLNAYYSGVIYGTIKDEDVWISFKEASFTVWSKDSLMLLFSGEYKTEDLNIILEPFQWYTDYPVSIILNFVDTSTQ